MNNGHAVSQTRVDKATIPNNPEDAFRLVIEHYVVEYVSDLLIITAFDLRDPTPVLSTQRGLKTTAHIISTSYIL